MAQEQQKTRTDAFFCVYKHTCPNGKVYIGKTCQKPEHRWLSNGNGYKRCVEFYRAIQRYGWENIKHEILFERLTKEEAEQKEIELIAQYKSNQKECGYNSTKGGDGTAGWRHSETTKQKMSLFRRGKKFSKEHCKKISVALKGQQNCLGRKLSNKTKEKIQKGQPHRKEINCYKNGILYKTYKSILAAAKELKLQQSNIQKVLKGQRNHTGGYTFREVQYER